VQTQPFSPTPVHTAEDAAVTEMLFVDNPQISPTTGSDVRTIMDSNSVFNDFTTFQDEPSIDRSHPPTTSPSETPLYSSINKPLDNNDLQSLALLQSVALNSFALGPLLFTVAQPAIPACDALHTLLLRPYRRLNSLPRPAYQIVPIIPPHRIRLYSSAVLARDSTISCRVVTPLQNR
jgi:hypothetical protein